MMWRMIADIAIEFLHLVPAALLIYGNNLIQRRIIQRKADIFAKIIMRSNIELTKEEWNATLKEKTNGESSKLIEKWNSH